jgi:CheY-like chemotaxis protein
VTPTRPATIVVLEENPAAQELIEQELRESGHRVLVTNNPSPFSLEELREAVAAALGDRA